MATTLILCVEDEADIRSDIVEELRDAGYETVEAANGREGLEAIEKRIPDLVLCDITMPQMNGYEMLAALRAKEPKYADLPFVFLSALADRKDRCSLIMWRKCLPLSNSITVCPLVISVAGMSPRSTSSLVTVTMVRGPDGCEDDSVLSADTGPPSSAGGSWPVREQ